MDKSVSIITIVVTILVFSQTISAQYSMGNGSYMTGYGQINGSLGYAMSLQNMYLTIQNMQRQSMRKGTTQQAGNSSQIGNSRGSNNSANSRQNSTGQVSKPPAAASFYGRFRPDASINMAKTLSDLFSDDNERRQMKLVVETVQKLYKEEAVSRKWGNNFAGGMTFFLVVLSTVYHDINQPGDETVKTIFDAVNQAIDAEPAFAKATDAEKTKLNEMLIGFTALPFLTYIEGKKEGNAETVQTARLLAGEMIRMILKTDPRNVKFDDRNLIIER